MREALNIVRGAVSKKDLIPVLTHFAINDNKVHGFNGRVHICSPVREHRFALPNFTVPAALALAAVDACKGEPVFQVTQEQPDRVHVSDSADTGFTAVLHTGKIEDWPIPDPVKLQWQKCSGEFLPLLTALAPFIGEDASRPWCASIRFQRGVAYATNNITLVEAKCKFADMLDCALPVFAVEELLRIGLEPTAVAQEGDSALYFALPGKVWIRTLLIKEGWPDAADVMNKVHEGAKLRSFNAAAIYEAVEKIKPLCADQKLPAIAFMDKEIRTEDIAGASSGRVCGFKELGNGLYHAEPLCKVLQAAVKADWSKFPRVPWSGAGDLRGAIMGLMR